MRRSLATKLVLSFLAVIAASAALVLVFIRSTARDRFQALIAQEEIATLQAGVQQFYAEHGSWEGFEETYYQEYVSEELQSAPGNGAGRGRLRGLYGVADAEGNALVHLGDYGGPGTPAPSELLDGGVPVELDGETIAIVFPLDEKGELYLLAEEQAYLERTNRALLWATLGSSAVALLLACLLIRTLVRPLRELTHATQAMRQGNLEQRVSVRSHDELGQLASAFNQMSSELAHASQARRRMTADIAHDLRTPLHVIAGYIEAMRDGVLEATPTRLGVVYAEIEHLQWLVSDLLTLSRVDAGELPLHREPLAVGDLLERVVATYADQASQQGVALQLDLSPELPPVAADPARMVQVLGNLVDNALRHTPGGGRVTLAARLAEGGVELSVRDTGEGIAAEDLPFVFDRFYRADKSRQGDTEHSGLGLAIAKGLVEAHGGRIWATSAGAGCGATLTFSLPSAPTSSGEPSPQG